jgi:hypothetical protein
MIEFAFGFCITLFIIYLFHKKDEEHRRLLIAIHDGDAVPDENGNIGWVIK